MLPVMKLVYREFVFQCNFKDVLVIAVIAKPASAILFVTVCQLITCTLLTLRTFRKDEVVKGEILRSRCKEVKQS